MRKRLTGTIAAVGLSLVTLLSLAHAQEFVFVSNRIALDQGRVYEEGIYTQNEIFIFRDGSEIRITNSPTRAEYEPAPSPDGRMIAYVYRDDPHPTDAVQDWRWHAAVIDAFVGREVGRWELAGTENMTAPAGGFRPTWLPDSQSFVTQVPGENGEWYVERFTPGMAAGERVARGFGVHVSPNGEQLATSWNGMVNVTNLATGQETPIAAGEPIGWSDDDNVFVAVTDALELIEVGSGSRRLLFDFYGYYGDLAHSADGRHYAFLLYQDDQWFVIISDSEHNFVEDILLPGGVYGLDWVDDERMLITLEKEAGDLGIATIDLEGNDPYISDSWADDFDARTIRRR